MNIDEIRIDFNRCSKDFQKVADTMKPNRFPKETADALFDLGLSLQKCGHSMRVYFDHLKKGSH